jgi:MFS transporter, AAHS family, 4-hydroxybenzoate transporter
MSNSERQAALAVAVLVLVYCAEAIDVFLVGKIAPAIAISFARPLTAMALVFTASQVGLVAGSLLGGAAGDRWGRRRIITLSLCCAAVLTACAAWTHSFALFTLLRGATALLLGAVAPCVLAVVAVTAPDRWRPLAITTTLAGSSLGSTLGSVVAFSTGTPRDWRTGFWICAAALGVAVSLFLALVPERPRLVIDRGTSRSAGLFGPMRPVTLLLGAGFLFSMGLNALLFAWLPSFFHAFSGIPVQRFAGVAMYTTPAGIMGMLAVGWLARRLPPRTLTLLCFGGYGCALALLGSLPFATIGFVVAMGAMSFGQASCQALLNIAVVSRYPDALRATALGAAAAIGRTGGLFAPGIGALMLGAQLPMQLLFMFIAAIPLLVGTSLYLLDRRHPSPDGYKSPA